ncbi:hypothetical protein MNB_SV-4-1235 [hydrothermal vent metagenome]|uniref:COG1399 protein, clustered with ribosomal protein L32p n=1 Tax=hydrothermal vent metagenome TaxID=652676 RepID=A0A1W1E869_9ZZZZ
MKIFFEKVGTTPKPLELSLQDVRIEGTLVKSGYHRVLLDAKLEGTLPLICDRCGKLFEEQLDTPLKLTLSDQVSEDKDDLDIIEFLDGVIDVTYILQSEINAIDGAFHYCDSCDGSDETLEIEF